MKFKDNNFKKFVASYNYDFPKELIAHEPASPRDSARLLVYNQHEDNISHSVFSNLLNFIPKNSVLVLNNTKVVPARIQAVKQTGGVATLLFLNSSIGQNASLLIETLSNKPLQNNSVLAINNKFHLKVIKKEDQSYFFEADFDSHTWQNLLAEFGYMPLPPYIKTKLSPEKIKQEYNTVFADKIGSVAAPTASLHFTPELLQKIEQARINICYTTLHVNLGTFAPLTQKAIEQNKLHKETYFIDRTEAEKLNQAKRDGKNIIAVGTTVVRTLESASNNYGLLTNLTGQTEIFITENYKLKFVDSLITNFHVPKSSLMMLVAAFINRQKLLQIYNEAIEYKYRLFSFGDAMFINSK